MENSASTMLIVGKRTVTQEEIEAWEGDALGGFSRS